MVKQSLVFKDLRVTLVVVGGWLFASGCAGDELSVGNEQQLEREDVENLPEGSAMGTAVTGRYVYTSFDERACSCRQGPTDEICGGMFNADGLLVAHLDGALAFQQLHPEMDLVDVILLGGIDEDGSLLVGGVNTVVDLAGEPIGDSVNLVEGVLEPMSGGELEWSSRTRAIVNGTSFDCSAVFDLSVSWLGPE